MYENTWNFIIFTQITLAICYPIFSGFLAVDIEVAKNSAEYSAEYPQDINACPDVILELRNSTPSQTLFAMSFLSSMIALIYNTVSTYDMCEYFYTNPVFLNKEEKTRLFWYFAKINIVLIFMSCIPSFMATVFSMFVLNSQTPYCAWKYPVSSELAGLINIYFGIILIFFFIHMTAIFCYVLYQTRDCSYHRIPAHDNELDHIHAEYIAKFHENDRHLV